jgi:hypothetical protein
LIRISQDLPEAARQEKHRRKIDVPALGRLRNNTAAIRPKESNDDLIDVSPVKNFLNDPELRPKPDRVINLFDR